MAFGKCRSTWQLPLRLSFSGLSGWRLSKCRAGHCRRALVKIPTRSFGIQILLLLLPFAFLLWGFSFSIKPVKFVKLDKFWTFQVVARRWARSLEEEVCHGMGSPFPAFLLYFPICISSWTRPNQWHLIKWRWLLLPHWQIVVVYLAAFWFWCVFDWLCGGTRGRGIQSIFLRCFLIYSAIK